MMFGYTIENFGFIIGAFIGIVIFYTLFHYAIPSQSSTRLQRIGIVILVGASAIGFSAFGEGTDNFENRITNLPTMKQFVPYSIGAFFISIIVTILENTERQKPLMLRQKIGRAVALVFVIPMVFIGVGNLVASSYSFVSSGKTSAPGLGVSRDEMREIMLNGELAAFWRMVDERAPRDLDYIIDAIFADEERYFSSEDVRQKLTQELADYRRLLAVYGPALADSQRIEILNSTLIMMKAVRHRPDLCVDLAITGGQRLSPEQLGAVGGLLNESILILVGNLLEAREQAEGQPKMPRPPNESDYIELFNTMAEQGATQD